AEDGPRLGARPGALVAHALVGVAALQGARRRVERGRLADAAVRAHAELDVPARMEDGEVPPRRLAGGGSGPDQEGRALDGVDGRLALADVAGLLGGGAEREAAGVRVVGLRPVARALERDLARRRVPVEERPGHGAVIEEKAAEGRVGRGARAQPLGPLERPAAVPRAARGLGGEPAHAGPEAARPVATGRGHPLAGGLGVVGKRALELGTGLVHALQHLVERGLPEARGHARLGPGASRGPGARRDRSWWARSARSARAPRGRAR